MYTGYVFGQKHIFIEPARSIAVSIYHHDYQTVRRALISCAVRRESRVSSDVALCRWYLPTFRKWYYLHLGSQVAEEESLTLNAKALRSFETSGTCVPTKEREILISRASNLTAISL